MRGRYERRRDRRDLKHLAAVGAVVTLLAGGGGIAGVADASGGNGSASTSTARVVRTNLASTEQVSGSIGYDGSYNMLNPAGSNAQAITQAQQQLAQAQQQLANDRTSSSDADASDAQSINQAQTAVNAAQAALDGDKAKQSSDCAEAGLGGAACSQDGQKVTQDEAQLAQQQAALATAQLNATRSKHQDDAKVQGDNLAVQNAQNALNTLERTATNTGTTYTALPAVGQVINRGQTLYAIDGKPVPLFYGSTPLWRSFQPGMSDGPDVAELTDNLIALGFGNGLSPGSHFSQATADAVKRWQASLGLDQTGAIRLGEVQFEPGPIRVTSVHPSLGGAAQPGPVLDATSTNRVVTVALAVTKEYLVHQGDTVSVLLPDGKTTTPGHVRDISTVATSPSGNGNNNANNTPTVNVTVTLDHPGETGNLDQAPVNVNITDQSVRGVLAVPINALLALAQGGDGVEVVSPDGSRHLVGVDVGLFSDTMVQVSGPGISEGMLVEVPSS